MLHTNPDLYKIASLAVLFGSNSNSYTFYTQVCVYIYTYSSQYRDASLAKEVKIIGTALYVQSQLFWCEHFGHAHYRFVSPGIDHFIHGNILSSGFQTFYFHNSLLMRAFMINCKGVGHLAILALQVPLCRKGLILTTF